MKVIEAILKVAQILLDLSLAAMMVWLIFNYRDIIQMIVAR